MSPPFLLVMIIEMSNQRVIFIMDGMPIEDLAWGYTVYENAKKMGLGTKLNLWEKTR